MGKAPALSACMFCEQLPCVCAARRAKANKPARAAKVTAPVVAATLTQAEVPAAPVATRKRFDATSAMSAEANRSESAMTAAVSDPLPAETFPGGVSGTGSGTNAVAANVDEAHVLGDSTLNYASHLVKVMLGGTVVE